MLRIVENRLCLMKKHELSVTHKQLFCLFAAAWIYLFQLLWVLGKTTCGAKTCTLTAKKGLNSSVQYYGSIQYYCTSACVLKTFFILYFLRKQSNQMKIKGKALTTSLVTEHTSKPSQSITGPAIMNQFTAIKWQDIKWHPGNKALKLWHSMYTKL